MPDPLSHHPSMTEIPITYNGKTYHNPTLVTYIEHKLPDYWWLNPWSHTRQLSSATGALNSLLRDLEQKNDRLIKEVNELEEELEATQEKLAALKLKYLQLHLPKKKSK